MRRCPDHSLFDVLKGRIFSGIGRVQEAPAKKRKGNEGAVDCSCRRRFARRSRWGFQTRLWGALLQEVGPLHYASVELDIVLFHKLPKARRRSVAKELMIALALGVVSQTGRARCCRTYPWLRMRGSAARLYGFETVARLYRRF